jgi:isoleucyl-tRNA synthetase
MAELEFVKKEEEILNFWQKNKIFEKSVENRRKSRPFIFYEGPPTANGRPGIHHVLARSFKDLICRYKTMRGFLVERKAGWDTHGLPVELEVEKELGFKNKTEIEKYGIKQFNKKAKESVWRYKEEWERLTERMGYWIDTKNPYITFDPNYIETVWWLIKQINQKGLLYKSYKVLPYCPRCSTPLSSHEVSLGYETIQDPSIFIKFHILNPKSEILKNLKDLKSEIYLLVWTTTPWTLPANVAIAVDSKLDYKLWQTENEILISYLKPPQKESKLLGEIKGKELIGEEYEPLYLHPLKEQEDKKIYEVVEGSFISTEEGTGLVHIAPAFGEDDMELSKKIGLAFIKNIDDKGCFIEEPHEVIKIKGKFFKEADPIIFKNLGERNLLYFGDLKGTTHEYPFCWRCHTPLLYYAFEAWYIKMSQVKKELIRNNQKINWVPQHIKEGRFGQWLREIKDWAISRNRYWGTPLPVWECDKCGHYEVIGSLKELEEKSGGKLPYNDKKEIDLHRPYVDEIKLKCPQCSGEMKRREELIDCWFDSGSMPYSQWHFPFEQVDNTQLPARKMIKQIPFPADYICEAVDQTRGWFYTLLAISTLLELGPAYKNVISLGLILDEKGEKMSKSKGNVVEPMEIIEKYGTDSLRWFLFTVNRPGEEKRFLETDLLNFQRRFLNTIWNVFLFYQTYAFKSKVKISNLSLLNQWILADLEETKVKVINLLDHYSIFEATKVLDNFVDDLSRWYLRRSRRIFQKPDNQTEWETSSMILRIVLKELMLLLAPFCPFFSEIIWQELKEEQDKESVHLADYSKGERKYQNKKILVLMQEIRDLSAKALSLRQKENLKVRQPLKELRIKNEKLKGQNELLKILKEEINVKDIFFDYNLELREEIKLDTQLTPELLEEGIIRELVRQVQEERKKQELVPKDKISIILEIHAQKLQLMLEQWKDFIKKETGAEELKIQVTPEELKEGISINKEKLRLEIKKV